ncbi:MAG: uracil-DNA glycosylase [Polyangiales bacterium]
MEADDPWPTSGSNTESLVAKRETLRNTLKQVRACEVCAKDLPLGPRPVVQVGARAKVIIIGQAPGTKVHESGVPWDDASGDHLREWLGVTKDVFYAAARFSILPMGFCYPGAKGGGDAPPRPECAPLWHSPLLDFAPKGALLLLVGMYAQKYYLGKERKKTLGDTVRAAEEYLPRFFPLPHPSWRSKHWMKKNPWFSSSILPSLQREIALRST